MVGAGVGEDVVGVDRPGQDPKQRDVAHVGVGEGLEHPDQRLAGRVAGDLLHRVAGLHLDRGAAVGRGGDLGQQCGQTIDAHSGSRRAAHHREDHALGHAGGQRGLQLGAGGDVLFEVALHEFVVTDDDPLDQLLAHLVLDVGQVARDRPRRRLPTVVEDGRVGEEVGDPPKAGVAIDRQLERGDTGTEPLAQVGQGAVEAGLVAVQLVDEHQAGEAQLAGQGPGGLGLRLDPLHRAHHHDHQVDDGARRPHLAEEVGIPRGVDDVELDPVDLARGERQRERHVVLDLLGLEVAHRRAVIDLARPVDGTGGEEERLRQGGLARTVVPDEGNVPDADRREPVRSVVTGAPVGAGDVGRAHGRSGGRVQRRRITVASPPVPVRAVCLTASPPTSPSIPITPQFSGSCTWPDGLGAWALRQGRCRAYDRGATVASVLRRSFGAGAARCFDQGRREATCQTTFGCWRSTARPWTPATVRPSSSSGRRTSTAM